MLMIEKALAFSSVTIDPVHNVVDWLEVGPVRPKPKGTKLSVRPCTVRTAWTAKVAFSRL